jgi:4-hydroxy-tetrahydrodipicolinate reductase
MVSLRAILRHSGLELVGVRVYSAAKDGLDAGDLCGLPRAGVAATRDIAAILALRPDCIVYMPDRCDYDEVCRFLDAGINVVTTRGEFHNPARMKPEIRERIEAACRSGGASIHSTGSSPGFITEALPIVLTSIQRRLDLLTIDEFADIAISCSPEMIFDVMGFGETPEMFARRPIAERDECFDHSLSLVAEALGLPFDRVEVRVETALAARPVQIGDRTIEPGTVAGQRIVTAGIRNGAPLLQFRTNWYVTTDLDPAWELQKVGWRVRVAGDAPLDIQIGFPLGPENVMATLAGYTANRPVNAVPYVCAAAPGIVTSVDLPQVIAQLG